MNAFDATKATINTVKSSPFASSMLIRYEIAVAKTPLPLPYGPRTRTTLDPSF